jgi:hypothetical protein
MYTMYNNASIKQNSYLRFTLGRQRRWQQGAELSGAVFKSLFANFGGGATANFGRSNFVCKLVLYTLCIWTLLFKFLIFYPTPQRREAIRGPVLFSAALSEWEPLFVWEFVILGLGYRGYCKKNGH